MFTNHSLTPNVVVLASSIVFAMAGLVGCAGGGTSGSGGGAGLQFSGTLRLQQGAPASGVTVSAVAVPVAKALIKSSNSAVTDNTGSFTLFVDAGLNEDVKLSFSGPSIVSSYLVTRIPAKAPRVKLSLTTDAVTFLIN